MATNQALLDNKYEILNNLGDGLTAKVYLVKDKTDNKSYAAKVLKDEQDKCFNDEVEVLKTKNLNNPYLIKYHDSGKGPILKKGTESKTKRYLITEYSEKGELYHYVHYPGKGLGEKCGKLVFYKILKGMEACHKAGICHRDLKLGNILLDSKFNPKICDFGFAKSVNTNNLKEYIGTHGYTAPEIINNQPYDGIKADIFSLGVVMFVLVTGKMCFKDAREEDKVYQYLMIPKPRPDKFLEKANKKVDLSEYSEQFKTLFVKMISFDPTKRPTIEEILKDDWVKDLQTLNKEESINLIKNVFNEFKGREKAVKEGHTQELSKREQDEEDDGNERGFEGELKNYFEETMKPKQLKDEDCLPTDYISKIKGSLEPVKFMNIFANKINSSYNVIIEESKKSLKFKITFEPEEEEDEEETEEDKEIRAELEKLGLGGKKLQMEKSSINVKLKQLEDGNFIIKYTKASGSIEEFNDNLPKIKTILSNLV